MSSNDPYYLNLLIMLGLLMIGVAAGYFTARRNGQETVVSLKNELITTLSQKVAHLENQLHDQRVQFEADIQKLKTENMRLTSLIDDLMTVEEARKRTLIRRKQPTPIQLPKTTQANTPEQESE